MTALERAWYGRLGWSLLLFPLSALYWLAITLKRWLYRAGVLSAVGSRLPVLVVGNISVGGTGKTPVVMALVTLLREHGFRPGIVSRGYGGRSPGYPLMVDATTDPQQCGDEPALLARRTAVPVVVDPDRVRAVQMLEAGGNVDVVISDDGLQHMRMARTLELAVVDGARRLGNGWLLPVGPLREPPARLRSVDAVLVQDGEEAEAAFHLRLHEASDLCGGERRPLASFAGKPAQAIAGIGHPDRFFQQLTELGLAPKTTAFPDHHRFTLEELRALGDAPILMTEKDAIKCRAHAPQLGPGRLWAVPAQLEFNSMGRAAIDRLLDRLRAHRAPTG